MFQGSAKPPAVAAMFLLLCFSSLALTQDLPRFPPPTARGAGTVTPPVGGYAPAPEPTIPGTVNSPRIANDEVDRAFWELYDRDKHVTLTGKVTAVNWTQPNVYVFLAAGNSEWAVEASYPQFRQATVNPAVQVGQTITIKGYLAKETPSPKWPVNFSPSVASYLRTKHLVRATELQTVYGQKLRLGRPMSEEEERAELLKCSRLGC